MLFSDLTQEILGCAFEVHKNLGYGFLEKVYHNALLLELKEKGLNAASDLFTPFSTEPPSPPTTAIGIYGQISKAVYTLKEVVTYGSWFVNKRRGG